MLLTTDKVQLRQDKQRLRARASFDSSDLSTGMRKGTS